MFDQLVKRSNSVWMYKTGSFAEERHTFLCDLNERGQIFHHLRIFAAITVETFQRELAI